MPSELGRETPASPVLEARALEVRDAGGRALVGGVDVCVAPGEVLGVVGESGSGKTLTLRACLGVLPRGLAWRVQTLALAGFDALGEAVRASSRAGARSGEGGWLSACSTQTPAFARVLGTHVGFVPQNTMEYLHPLMRVRAQMTDGYLAHVPGATRASALERARELLACVGIEDAGRVLDAYPAELSGGMRQRVNIACALMGSPELLVADEPTAALDAAHARRVVGLLADEARRRGIALVMVSHNLGAVASCADRLLVMRAGHVVEGGCASEVFASPRDAYTRALVSAVPRRCDVRVRAAEEHESAGGASPDSHAPVLEARAVTKRFGSLTAVDDVSFALYAGRTLGVVGESGSGKSTLGELVGGLTQPDAGEVLYDGRALATLDREGRRAYRRSVQFVFQDPVASMNPTFTVERALADAQRALFGRLRRAAREHSREMLARVGLEPDVVMARHARELSGGQAQRVAVARALLAEPRVLVCDECTSALDVTVQARLLDLLRTLQDELGCALLFVSHDMGVVAQMADEVLVMRGGRVVERGSAGQVLTRPREAYTRTLVDAAFEAPRADGGAR